MTKDEITPLLLRELLNYNSETGELFWKERAVEMFPKRKEGLRWNTRYAGKKALSSDKGDGYLSGRIFSHTFMAHRVVYAIHTGHWPVEEIDHVNGVRHDNRFSNLRDATPSDNAKNRKVRNDNTSGVVGVSFHRGSEKWVAQTVAGGTYHYGGIFDNFSDAVAARLKAETELGFHENHGRAA